MREFDKNLEVALSGGGLRAAAFALGVLLYLVHSGLSARVKTISSVSGGSITNGFIAQKCDFSSCPAEEFKKVAQDLAANICGQGSLWCIRGFFAVKWLFFGFFVIGAVGLLAWFVPMAVVLLAQLIYGAKDLPPVSFPEFGVFFVTLLIWAVVVLNREWLVRRWLSRTFFREKESLGSLSRRSVDHVFCATDLNASCPFFFSTKGRGRVFSEIYGRGDGRNEELVDAVRASAAFPPAIPPRHFEIRGRQLTNWKEKAFPPKIVLSDGGIWNNLGTDWSRLQGTVLAAEEQWVKKEFSITEDDAQKMSRNDCPRSDVLLVANASKPDKLKHYESQFHKVPGVSFMRTVIQGVNVALNSTIAGRSVDVEASVGIRLLNDPDRWEVGAEAPSHQGIARKASEGAARPLAVLVEMTRKPGETANAYKRVKGPPEWEHKANEYASRLTQPLEALKLLLEGEDSVPTTFDNLGPDRTLRLIVLGYLNTRETLAVVFTNHNPPAIPEREWFEHLVPQCTVGRTAKQPKRTAEAA